MKCALFALFTFTILVTSGFSAQTNKKLSELQDQTNGYIHSNKRILSVDRVDSSHIVYAASVYMTLNVPFTETAQALMKFEGWSKIFKSITCMQKISGGSFYHDNSVIYYAEAKYSFIRGWGLGVLNKLDYKPNSSVFCEVIPVSDGLFYRYLKRNHGVIQYHVKKMNVQGTLIRLNDSQCRIGIFAWAGVNKEMPIWLIETLMKIVMPSFVGDLERYVKRQIKEN